MKYLLKYLFVLPIFMIFFIISLLIGCITFMWKFSKRDFRKGSSYINENIIEFADWLKK